MIDLKTDRILLRSFTEKDLNNLHEIMSNEKVASLAGFNKKNNYLETKTILNCFLNEPANALWAIELINSNKVIGWIELHSPSENLHRLAKEIGFVLSEYHWGQGLMPEAINRILNYAFTTLDVPSIVCSHFKSNTQSKRVIEKCNFKFDTELENKYYYIIKNH